MNTMGIANILNALSTKLSANNTATLTPVILNSPNSSSNTTAMNVIVELRFHCYHLSRPHLDTLPRPAQYVLIVVV